MKTKMTINLTPSFSRLLLHVVFALFCVAWVYPFLWMISASSKTSLEIFQKGLNLIPDSVTIEAYQRAWTKGGFSTYFSNSVITTSMSIVIVVVRCALAGYVLAMYDFKGKKLILSILIATFLIPTGTTIIPIVELSQKNGFAQYSSWPDPSYVRRRTGNFNPFVQKLL